MNWRNLQRAGADGRNIHSLMTKLDLIYSLLWVLERDIKGKADPKNIQETLLKLYHRMEGLSEDSIFLGPEQIILLISDWTQAEPKEIIQAVAEAVSPVYRPKFLEKFKNSRWA